ADWLVPGCETCLSGQTIEIDHGNGLLTFYGHLSKILVSKGQYVARGQGIAISGMTDTATGPHRHFGVYKTNCNSCPVDPYGWSGSYADPWTRDVGDLWGGGSPRLAPVPLPSITVPGGSEGGAPATDRFAQVQLPSITVTAGSEAADPTKIDVAWRSPGTNSFTVYVVGEDGSR